VFDFLEIMRMENILKLNTRVKMNDKKSFGGFRL
jgi:hypothetical protein